MRYLPFWLSFVNEYYELIMLNSTLTTTLQYRAHGTALQTVSILMSQLAIMVSVTLPDQPLMIKQLQAIDYDLQKVAAIIKQHDSIATEVLKTVNAPYFMLVREIPDLGQAVRLLGQQRILNITNSALIEKTLSGDAFQTLESFWKVSNNTAILSVLLAKRFKYPYPDQAYALGLFHNAGIPLLVQQVGAQYWAISKQAYEREAPYCDTERNHLEIDHCQIGYDLAKKWDLPIEICDAIAMHHDVAQITQALADKTDTGHLLACLKLAEQASLEFGYLAKTQRNCEWKALVEPLAEYVELPPTGLANLIATVRSEFNKTKSA